MERWKIGGKKDDVNQEVAKDRVDKGTHHSGDHLMHSAIFQPYISLIFIYVCFSFLCFFSSFLMTGINFSFLFAFRFCKKVEKSV